MKKISAYFVSLLSLLASSCANIQAPDGGPYDETPPQVVGSTPEQNAVNTHNNRITLLFSEIVRLDNAAEKVIISPPQIEQPEIRASGRRITVALKDSLKPSTTYTIDFSDAIEDNTEGNPLGNYAFVFSTGEKIDSMEVSGNVLEASNLEPIKGILVGLHSDLNDSAFNKKPFERVARTDGRGHFTIKGVAPGKYRVYALEDAENDFIFAQKSEKIAFLKDIIVPTSAPATRNDTTWIDSTHIDSIRQVAYTRYMPDDIILRAFEESNETRYLIKADRTNATHFSFYFSGPAPQPPRIKGLNFNEEGAFLEEHSAGNDTLTYWLKSMELVRQDTLEMEFTYLYTDDSTGVLTERTDTLELVPKTPYSKIEEDLKKEVEHWNKQKERAQKRNAHFNTARPQRRLRARYPGQTSLYPNENLAFTFEEPIATIDSSRIHLKLHIDSLYEDKPFILQRDSASLLRYTLYGEWRPGQEYKLLIDTAALRSIYGLPNVKIEMDFSIPRSESYASLFLKLSNVDEGDAYVQLLNKSDNVVRQVKAKDGRADFFFLKAGTYYLRLYVDQNHNGKWDTGLYSAGLQPEPVYYYPSSLRLKANWDTEQDWNVRETLLTRQKPAQITKQKPDKAKTVKSRNAEREKRKNK